jgi:hypothetical protein
LAAARAYLCAAVSTEDAMTLLPLMLAALTTLACVAL